MQQELIEMLEEIIQYVEVWNAHDQGIIDKAEALVEKAKNSAKEPAVPQGVIYEKADSLYKRGYTDRQNGKDYDPRGCDEWQEVVDWLTPAAPVQEPAVPRGIPAQEVIDAIEAWKSAWLKVPPFADRVNKATREAITISHNSLFLLLQSAQQAQRMPAGCTTPTGCGPHGCHGACIAATPAAPSQQVTDAWADGVQSAADLLKRMAVELVTERGETDPDTGAIQFKSAATREWHASLCELAEEIERLKPAAPSQGEPVAWMLPRDGDDCAVFREPNAFNEVHKTTGWVPLYTAAASQEPDMHIGACITDGVLHATVMRREANGHVTILATAEMDAKSLLEHDCVAKLSPAAPSQPVTLTDRQFDLICQAIDKADTITMEGDYMLDSDDCIGVVRVMQALFSIAALREKEGG